MRMKAFEIIVWKENNAGNQHFLHFPQCFLYFLEELLIFNHIISASANSFNLDQPKYLLLSKELTHYQMTKFWTGSKSKHLQVTSIFSFSHNVFKSCLVLMSQNEYLWSKGYMFFQSLHHQVLTKQDVFVKH